MNIKTRDIMACLPLLASILGDRYGVKVLIGGSEACTDGTTIYLPTLPLDCEESLLALVRGYCDHEAAHIRYTDFEALRVARLTPMQKHLWNSIEDWRVETELVSIFPGCRRNFQWLIQQFFGNDDGAGANPALSVLNWVVLTVRAWELPAIEAQRDMIAVVIDSAFPGLRPKLEAVLVRVKQCCRNSRESIAYALELAAIIEKYVQQPQASAGQQDKTPDKKPDTSTNDQDRPDIQDEQDTTDKSDGQDSSVNQEEDEEKAGLDTPDEQKEEKAGLDTPDEQKSEDQSAGQNDSTDSASDSEDADAGDYEAEPQQSAPSPHPLSELLQAPADELPMHLGELMAESLNALQEKNDECLLSVARVGHKSTVILADDLREEALKSCTALRTRLQALLQAKAQKPCVTGRRGKLHIQRLHALAVNNPRVFLKQGETTLTSTAVHLLLDCSGSMQGSRLELASLACYAVAKALEGCKGVNVGVTLFPANDSHPDAQSVTTAPLVRHGERVHSKFCMYASGDTPLAESLWWVMQQMYPLREERKIILVLSDGVPDSLPAAHHAFKQGEALGFEMMGLGIQDNHMAKLLPKTSRTIDDLQSLAPAMFDMLQKALLNQEGGRI